MSDVTFNEEPTYAAYAPAHVQSKGISGWLISKGIVKTDKGADTVMIATAIGGILVTVVYLAFLLPGDHTFTPQERAKIEATTPRAPK